MRNGRDTIFVRPKRDRNPEQQGCREQLELVHASASQPRPNSDARRKYTKSVGNSSPALSATKRPAPFRDRPPNQNQFLPLALEFQIQVDVKEVRIFDR